MGSYAGSAASAFAGEFVGVVVGGAVGGAVGGGLNAAFYGTNIGDGMLQGALYGGVAAAVIYGISQGIAGLTENGKALTETGGDDLSPQKGNASGSTSNNTGRAPDYTDYQHGPGTKYAYQHSVAKQLCADMNPASITQNREFGAMICTDGSNFEHTTIVRGLPRTVNPGGPSACPRGSWASAYVHSHGNTTGASEVFSKMDGDLGYARGYKIDAYLCTPRSGRLLYYNYNFDNRYVPYDLGPIPNR